MGLGLGTSRMYADNDFLQVDSDKKTVHDLTSGAYNSLDEDAQQNLSATFAAHPSDSNKVVATVKRKLDTGDFKDFVIQLDRTFDVSWAYNSKTSNIGSYHSKRGSFKMLLASSGEGDKQADIPPQGDEKTDEEKMVDDEWQQEEDAASTISTVMAAAALIAVVI